MHANQCSANTRRAATEPQQFPPLELVNRPTVPTEQAAHYLLRRPQTLRGWACAETFPDGLRPVRVNGRLGWPVAGIKAALGGCVMSSAINRLLLAHWCTTPSRWFKKGGR